MHVHIPFFSNLSYYNISVQRSAVPPPLLRLPAELRNLIFEYAMEVNTVSIQRQSNESTSKQWCETSTSTWHGRATHLGDRRRKNIGIAFHLPEVCRQIYAETVTLGYATNTFSLSYSLGDRSKTPLWDARRNGAQLSAIKSINVFWLGIWNYMMELGVRRTSTHSHLLRRSMSVSRF
jgi:hypothetical protein